MWTKKDELLTDNVSQMMQLFGSDGVAYHAVNFAKALYVKNNYYELMQNLFIEDIDGVTNVIMITVTQMFLSMFDLIQGTHHIICSDTPTTNDYARIAVKLNTDLETFLHASVVSIINNARRLDQPKDWIPELRPVINDILTEKYNKAMNDLQNVGHDCSQCHIFKDRKECSIYEAIPKPFGYQD